MNSTGKQKTGVSSTPNTKSRLADYPSNQFVTSISYANEETIHRDYICCICEEVFKDPVTTPCDHTFCKECLYSWLSAEDHCPFCRTKITLNDVEESTRVVRNYVDDIKMECGDCKKQMPRSQLKDHLVSCPAVEIGCNALVCCEHIDLHIRHCQFFLLRRVLLPLTQQLHELKQRNAELEIQMKDLRLNNDNEVQLLQAKISSLEERTIKRSLNICGLSFARTAKPLTDALQEYTPITLQVKESVCKKFPEVSITALDELNLSDLESCNMLFVTSCIKRKFSPHELKAMKDVVVRGGILMAHVFASNSIDGLSNSLNNANDIIRQFTNKVTVTYTNLGPNVHSMDVLANTHPLLAGVNTLANKYENVLKVDTTKEGINPIIVSGNEQSTTLILLPLGKGYAVLFTNFNMFCDGVFQLNDNEKFLLNIAQHAYNVPQTKNLILRGLKERYHTKFSLNNAGPLIRVSSDGKRARAIEDVGDLDVSFCQLDRGIKKGKMTATLRVVRLNTDRRQWFGISGYFFQKEWTKTKIADMVAFLGTSKSCSKIDHGKRTDNIPTNGLTLDSGDSIQIILDMNKSQVSFVIDKNGKNYTETIGGLPDETLFITVGLYKGGEVELVDILVAEE